MRTISGSREEFFQGIGSPLFLAALWLAAGTIAIHSEPGAPPSSEPNIPIIRLRAEKGIASDVKVPCTVQFVCPAGAESCPATNLAGVVRYHGASSQAYPKKSFGLTLDAPAPLLGMASSVHWVLNAAFIDRSLMRHKLSYDLFLAIGSVEAPRYAAASRFVEVYLNGNYQGAYLLMQRVDRALLQLRPFSSNETRHACIYKAVDHAANFSQPGHGGYEQREPDPLIGAFWRPLDTFDRFVSTSSDSDFFDSLKGIASRLDMDNAIDFHLLVLLTSNGDGITKNFILARDAPAEAGEERRFFFAPWDYDATFGRNWNATIVPPTAWLSNHLFDRLFANADYRKKYTARWKQLRKNQFSAKALTGSIDSNVRTFGEAVHRNAAKWKAAAGYYPDKLTFEEDIAQMKTWIEERLQWLDQKFAP